MKLYNINTDKIENIKIISYLGTHYVDRLTEAELNSFGYYKIEYQSAPNRRYYTATSTSTSTLIGNKWTVSYKVIEKPLADIQALMIKDLSIAFKAKMKRPIVDTGLGYSIDGGRDDLTNFTIGREFEFPLIKDYEGIDHPATLLDYDKAILAIKAYGVTTYQEKWSKEAEINAMATVEDCILYEATPYDYILTAEDVSQELALSRVEGDIVTRYKNQVKDW